MIIEINAISATEARELGKTYRFYQSKANEQLAIVAAKVIEAIITPSIKQDAKTSNFSYFEAHKTRTCYNNLQELLNIIDGNDYHFNYGFYCDYKDNESEETYHYTFAPSDIFNKMKEMLNKLGYTTKITYEYCSSYYKDFAFTITW